MSSRVQRSICIVRQQTYYELPVRREAEAFRDAGFEVHVILQAGEERVGRTSVDGVTLHRLPGNRVRGGALRYLWDYTSFFVMVMVYLTWLQVRHRLSVIQVNTMPDSLVFATIWARLLGAKVTVFMKEPVPELFRTIYGRDLDRVLIPVEQAAIRFADKAFTVTDELKDAYVSRGADPSRISVVLNGPDPRNLLDLVSDDLPDTGDRFVAACNGTIEDRYGQDVLLDAVAIAREIDPRIQVRISGSGTSLPALEKRAEKLGLGDSVVFLGWLTWEGLVQELQAADVGVVAMKANAYSHLIHTNKMYDYTIFGKPVVASRLRSMERYFDDDAVYYFEPGDPESLARALLKVASDPAEASFKVKRAQELLATRWGWDHQKKILVDRTSDLLEVRS